MNTLELIKRYVASKGYGLIEEMDRSVVFYYKLAKVHAVADLNDEHFCSVILPNFDEVTQDNVTKLILRCNRVSADLKSVKCYVTNDNILAAVEFYYLEEDDFEMQMGQALSAVSSGRDKYEEIAESEENEAEYADMDLQEDAREINSDSDIEEYEDIDDLEIFDDGETSDDAGTSESDERKE